MFRCIAELNWSRRPHWCLTPLRNGAVLPRNSRTWFRERTRFGTDRHTARVDDDRPPICPVCGVTMVAAELSAQPDRSGDWVCLECEETGDAS
jgi:hypothetical protein